MYVIIGKLLAFRIRKGISIAIEFRQTGNNEIPGHDDQLSCHKL